MVQKIERDVNRFKQIIRGKIRQDLRRYMSHGELIGKQGKDLVSIPLPQLDIPHFRYGDKGRGGVSSGEGEPGQSLGPGQEGEGSGQAGNSAGGHILEVEVPMAELAEILGEELELPRIQPKSADNIITTKEKYTGVSRTGPESLRHFKRTFKRALRRQISTGNYAPDDPRIIPIKEDQRYRSWKSTQNPDTRAVVIYMMDVSGSMGDEQKEIVRIQSFWINAWLRSNYEGIATRYVVHDADAREVDENTFFRTRESGGTMISSAYKLCRDMIASDYPVADWNIYALHFSDGDNWADDDAQCLAILGDDLLPALNLFGYAQVHSPYGSGRFLDAIKSRLGERKNIVLSEVPDRESILDSIKMLLGKGL
jgi:uncharacterized sporulation protein YeaH/YhbH (DUF444 family)